MPRYPTSWRIGLFGFALAASDPVLALDPIRDSTLDFFYTEGSLLQQVPGLAFSSAGEFNGDIQTSCTRLRVPFCDATGVPVDVDLDLSEAGITIIGNAAAGNDMAATSLTAASSGSTLALSPFGQAAFNLVATDWQLLRFEVPGAAPATIEVDMTYTLSAALDDRSGPFPDSQGYTPFVSAGLGVYEVDSYDGATIFTPFTHTLVQRSSGTNMLAGAVETLTVKPNTDYWLILSSQSNLQLRSHLLEPAVFDFAGLDVDLASYADPVFSLNPAFAATNPDVAATLQIDRVSVVPLPPSLLLLVIALLPLGRLRRGHPPRAS